MTDRVRIALEYLSNGLAELAEALEENDNRLHEEMYNAVFNVNREVEKNKRTLKNIANTILNGLED